MKRETRSLPKCFISCLLINVKKLQNRLNLGLWLKKVLTLTAKLKRWEVCLCYWQWWWWLCFIYYRLILRSLQNLSVKIYIYLSTIRICIKWGGQVTGWSTEKSWFDSQKEHVFRLWHSFQTVTRTNPATCIRNCRGQNNKGPNWPSSSKTFFT